MRINICNVNIDNITFIEAIKNVEDLVLKRRNVYVITPNVDHIVNINKDDEFKRIYNEAALVLPDGMPLIWAAKLLGRPLKEKISGSDLFLKLCKMSFNKGYKVYFLGGREKAAEKSAEILKIMYPGIQIAGIYCPRFGFENDPAENNKITEMIKAAKPDILFVGIGSPKQEKWIYKHKNEYRVPVSIGVGAAFDFMSGMIRRAPVWMQKAGLEWFWRLMMEPKRLWKRYLIDDPVFFWLVLKQKLGLFK